MRDIHSSVHPTRPCSHVIQAFFPQVPFFQSAPPFNIFGSFFFGTYYIMRLSVLPDLFIHGLPLLGLWSALWWVYGLQNAPGPDLAQNHKPRWIFSSKMSCFWGLFFSWNFQLIGFMVCLFWVHGLPLLGLWSASSGFMLCLFWVHGLPLLGSWFAFSEFMDCFFWVYDLWFVITMFEVLPKALKGSGERNVKEKLRLFSLFFFWVYAPWHNARAY